jgi:pleiotropic regulator 1
MATMSPDPYALLNKSQKRTRAVFGEEYTESIDVDNEPRHQTASFNFADSSHRARIACKIRSEYESVKELPYFLAEKQGKTKQSTAKPAQTNGTIQTKLIEDVQRSQKYLPEPVHSNSRSQAEPSNALTVRLPTTRPHGTGMTRSATGEQPSTSIIRRDNYKPTKPEWHAPWKLKKVIRYVSPFPFLFKICTNFK